MQWDKYVNNFISKLHLNVKHMILNNKNILRDLETEHRHSLVVSLSRRNKNLAMVPKTGFCKIPTLLDLLNKSQNLSSRIVYENNVNFLAVSRACGIYIFCC